MRYKLIHLIFLIFISLLAFSQEDINILKKEFKKDKEGFKEAWKAIKRGDEAYDKGGLEYNTALNEYLTASEYNNYNPQLNYKIGICYFYLDNYKDAFNFFNKAIEFKEDVTNDVHFFMGRCQHLLNNFEKAKEEYYKYQAGLSIDQLKNEEQFINKYIYECDNALELVQNSINVYIENLGEPVNTKFSDYFPVFSNDKSEMYFTSRREKPRSDKQNPYDYKYFEDIYVANNVNDNWTDVAILTKPVNSESNDVAVYISADGNIFFIYRGKEGGDIYECIKKEGKWTKPALTKMPINSKAKESAIFLTSDKNTLFFVSDRTKGSLGGKDIFMVTRKDVKKWNDPVNIGVVINTEYNEEGIFYDEDKKILYFSSEGHNSMGGYDVFKSIQDNNGNWTKPENLGYPVNTPGDDVFFSISKDGRIGYYSSSRQENGLGSLDIYKIYFLGPEKEPLLISQNSPLAYFITPVKDDYIYMEEVGETKSITILKGVVRDQDSLNPILAHIELVDNETNTLIYETYSDSITGDYFVTLLAGKSYGISVSAEGYLFYSEYFDIPDTAKFEEIEKEILLSPIKEGGKLVLKNIFFEFGKSTLREESFVELGFAVKVFKENPNMRVEISGHTDNVGGYQENINLSTDRAKSVLKYLVDNGIDPARLEYKGYGYDEPIASNDTEEGRQQNRRVEFKILSE